MRAAAACLIALLCVTWTPVAVHSDDAPVRIGLLLLQPIAVTEKNLGATIISDGFHSADEIKKALVPGEWEKFSSRGR